MLKIKKGSSLALFLVTTIILTACVGVSGDFSEGASSLQETSYLSEDRSMESIFESIIESISESMSESSNTNSVENSLGESSISESSKSESIPETSKPETSKPDTSKPETSKPDTSDTVSEDPNPPKPKTVPKVAYIPLDDRPVNVDRVKYQAAAGGLELLIPDADIYSTKLDGRGTNSNGTKYGDRQALVNWLKTVDKDCDYFVISLDQMLSGGLVSSRSMSSEDLIFEYSIMDYLSSLAKNNKLYVFDTVMRLASTVGYDGYSMTEYNNLRNYGVIPRKQLSGSSLNVENIISTYRVGLDGNTIGSSLSSTVIDKYLKARARKLRLVDYMLTKNLNNDNVYFFVGIDDSSPNITIQTNEINYIKSKLGTNGVIFAGTDELGMMGIARLGTEHFEKRLKVSVKYYGGQENSPADMFDIGTLATNMQSHLESLNAVIITSGKPDLEILVLTKQSSAHSSNATELLNRANTNFGNKIPTAIIDASGKADVLQQKMIESLEMSMLVGYSSWNTVGNAIGISLGQSFSRVAYRKSGEDITEKSNEGFLKSMTFAYIKDISYITGSSRGSGFVSLSQVEIKSRMMSSKSVFGASSVLDNFNSGLFITGLGTYETSKVGRMTLDNFRLPWDRSFEMTFTIQRLAS
ncbi:MAG: DUF4127 family protein [Eubacteriales bacterium]|nr:DUF4127 family protein [Eubacteriales bacterium]